jgi:hypothetical protein
MKPQDVFGIIVRTFGLIVIFVAVRSISVAIVSQAGPFVVLLRVIHLALGLALVFYGGCIARLAYRSDKSSS